MRTWMAILWAVLAVSSSTQIARAEFCGAMGQTAKVVATDLVIPGDGGILVASVPGNGPMDGDAADQPTWTFRTGGVSSAPRRTTLAPGLVVYHARQDGNVTLVDKDDQQQASAFVTRRPRARLPAPVVSWIVRDPERSDVMLALVGEPPIEAVAIVVVGKNGKARSWDFIDHDSVHQRVFGPRGCETQAAGTEPSQAGEHVTVFFVDLYGRPSPHSKEITIASKTPSQRRLSDD
ncbi:MAG: hypothetical protein ACKV2T_42280 [Kofleriaceae bacterium]